MLSSLLWLLCSLLILSQPHWHLLSLRHATDLVGLQNFYLYASDLTSFLSWCPGLSDLFLAYVAINTLALGHWVWNDILKQIPVLEFWLLLLLNSPLPPLFFSLLQGFLFLYCQFNHSFKYYILFSIFRCLLCQPFCHNAKSDELLLTSEVRSLISQNNFVSFLD